MEKLEYVVRVNAGQKVQPKIISIRGTSDMFDRYKMRQLYVQVIGKGKMIRTVFLNVDEVAKDLKTEPSYLGAYFGYELGASSKYDAKKSERERASISGEYDTQQLSVLMKKFVREIVQCPGCHLPETTLSLDKKTGDISSRCSSCGHTGVLKVENPKFLKFMTTHPPTVVNTKTIQAKQAAKKADAAAGVTDEGEKTEDKEGAKPAAAAAPAEPRAPKPAKAKARVPDDVDDNDWAVSTDAAAVKQRMADLLPSAAVKALVAAPDAPTLTLEKAAEEWKASLARPSITAEQYTAELARIAGAAKFDSVKTAVMAFDGRLNAQSVSTKDILKANSAFLEPFVEEQEAQVAILSRVEEFCAERPELIKTKRVTSIMKELYDLGLVSEEAVLEWFELKKPGDTAAAVRKEIEVLVNWLKTAEEDEEEEEEEEEEKKS